MTPTDPTPTRQAHTPEHLWQRNETLLYALNQDGGNRITAQIMGRFLREGQRRLYGPTRIPNEEPEATAARFLACYQACAGMADPAAELADLRARLATIERETAEACAAIADRCAHERREQLPHVARAGGFCDAVQGKLTEAERIAATIRARFGLAPPATGRPIQDSAPPMWTNVNLPRTNEG